MLQYPLYTGLTVYDFHTNMWIQSNMF
jgi:hypothetical protein